MANKEKNKYSASELVEFEKLILEKMELTEYAKTRANLLIKRD